MKFEAVRAALSGQEWGITEEQGRLLFDYVLRAKATRVLELGTGIGTSACYVAAALDELGGGTITTIDRNAELPEHVRRTFAKANSALLKYVRIVTTTSSYNDELLPLIEAQTRDGRCEPCFDLCYIDGAHTWEADGCAFFLADKLLAPGGMMLFDDMAWTIAGSPTASKEAWWQSMAPALRATAQVTKVFDLLVMQHPDYDDFVKAGDWGWARKKGGAGLSAKSLFTPPTLRAEVIAVARKVVRHFGAKLTGK
jgi:predicted O-methyltransferase YrrM